jgi:hypothetical protein
LPGEMKVSDKPKDGGGTYLERRMFQSKAFLSLQGSAAQLLILFLGKRNFDQIGKKRSKKYVCVNSESITFTYIEAEKKFGFTKPRFLRAIDELLEKGFIEIKYQGGGYKRDKTVYALSTRWTFWTPGTVCQRRQKDPVSRGFRRPKRRERKVDAVH